MVNNSIIINHHSLKRKKGGQHHLMLEMQVMAWDRINVGVRKKCIATGYANDHSKQLMLVVNMAFSMHKELVYVP